jgi:molybdopterin converting factor small subunit
MTISVQFHGHHRMTTRTGEIRMPLSVDTRVEDVVNYVSYRFPDLELCTSKVLVLVNNSITAMDHALNPNDKITFLPPVGGG